MSLRIRDDRALAAVQDTGSDAERLQSGGSAAGSTAITNAFSASAARRAARPLVNGDRFLGRSTSSGLALVAESRDDATGDRLDIWKIRSGSIDVTLFSIVHGPAEGPESRKGNR